MHRRLPKGGVARPCRAAYVREAVHGQLALALRTKGEGTMKHRITGVVFLLAAWFLYRQGIHVPLAQMKAHAPEIRFWNKLIICLPAVIGFGLFQLLLGEKMEGKASAAFAMAAIPLLGLGIWWWVWFGKQVDLYGYGRPHVAQLRMEDPEPFPEPTKASLADDRVEVVDAKQQTHTILWSDVKALRVTRIGGTYYHPGPARWYWSFEDTAGRTSLVSLSAIDESQMMPEVHRLAGPSVYIRDHPVDDAITNHFDGPGSSWMVWMPRHAM